VNILLFEQPGEQITEQLVIIKNNRMPGVAAVHYMIDRARILNAKRSCHPESLLRSI